MPLSHYVIFSHIFLIKVVIGMPLASKVVLGKILWIWYYVCIVPCRSSTTIAKYAKYQAKSYSEQFNVRILPACLISLSIRFFQQWLYHCCFWKFRSWLPVTCLSINSRRFAIDNNFEHFASETLVFLTEKSPENAFTAFKVYHDYHSHWFCSFLGY